MLPFPAPNFLMSILKVISCKLTTFLHFGLFSLWIWRQMSHFFSFITTSKHFHKVFSCYPSFPDLGIPSSFKFFSWPMFSKPLNFQAWRSFFSLLMFFLQWGAQIRSNWNNCQVGLLYVTWNNMVGFLFLFVHFYFLFSTASYECLIARSLFLCFDINCSLAK